MKSYHTTALQPIDERHVANAISFWNVLLFGYYSVFVLNTQINNTGWFTFKWKVWSKATIRRNKFYANFALFLKEKREINIYNEIQHPICVQIPVNVWFFLFFDNTLSTIVT